MLVIRGDRRVADIYYTEFNRLFNHSYLLEVRRGQRRRLFSWPTTAAGAHRVPDETDGWTKKYIPGYFLSLSTPPLYASMAGTQVFDHERRQRHRPRRR